MGDISKIPDGTMFVGSEGNVGRWSTQFQKIVDLRSVGDWGLRSITPAVNDQGALYGSWWCVGQNGNVGLLTGDTMDPSPKFEGLPVDRGEGYRNIVTINTSIYPKWSEWGPLLCTRSDGSIHVWRRNSGWWGAPWSKRWDFASVAMSPGGRFGYAGVFFCVGTHGNAGWQVLQGPTSADSNSTVGMRDANPPDNAWGYKMLAWDQQQRLWCIGQNGNLGLYENSSGTWEDFGLLSGWSLDWVDFGFPNVDAPWGPFGPSDEFSIGYNHP